MQMIGALTKRQVDVARELVRGMTQKEIAYELGISVSSVKQHIKNMARILGTDERDYFTIPVAVALVEAAKTHPLIAAALDLYF